MNYAKKYKIQGLKTQKLGFENCRGSVPEREEAASADQGFAERSNMSYL